MKWNETKVGDFSRFLRYSISYNINAKNAVEVALSNPKEPFRSGHLYLKCKINALKLKTRPILNIVVSCDESKKFKCNIKTTYNHRDLRLDGQESHDQESNKRNLISLLPIDAFLQIICVKYLYPFEIYKLLLVSRSIYDEIVFAYCGNKRSTDRFLEKLRTKAQVS